MLQHCTETKVRRSCHTIFNDQIRKIFARCSQLDSLQKIPALFGIRDIHKNGFMGLSACVFTSMQDCDAFETIIAILSILKISLFLIVEELVQFPLDLCFTNVYLCLQLVFALSKKSSDWPAAFYSPARAEDPTLRFFPFPLFIYLFCVLH